MSKRRRHGPGSTPGWGILLKNFCSSENNRNFVQCSIVFPPRIGLIWEPLAIVLGRHGVLSVCRAGCLHHPRLRELSLHELIGRLLALACGSHAVLSVCRVVGLCRPRGNGSHGVIIVCRAVELHLSRDLGKSWDASCAPSRESLPFAWF